MYNFFIMTSSFSVNIVFKIDNKDCGDVGKKRAQKIFENKWKVDSTRKKGLGSVYFPYLDTVDTEAQDLKK